MSRAGATGRAAVLVAVLLAACQQGPPPKPEPIELCTPEVVFAADLGAFPCRTGVPKQVQQAMLVTGCDGGTLSQLAASARVVDSSGHAVDSQVSLVTGGPNNPDWFLDDSDGGTLVVATVTFTPPAPGSYLGAVRFEPSLGTEQFEAFTVADQRDGGSHHATVAGPCADFDVMGDVTLCQTGADVWTSTGAVLPGKAFAVDGENLWALTDTDLVVAQFDGGSLFIQASAPLPSGFFTPSPVLLAKDGAALLVGLPQVVEVQRSPAGLDFKLVAVLQMIGAFGAQWTPGDGAIIGDGQSFCYFGFAPTPALCVTRSVIGADGDLLFTREGSGLTGWRIDGGVPEEVPLQGFDGFTASVSFAGVFSVPFSVNGGELVMPTREMPPRLADYGPITPIGLLGVRFAGRHLYWQQLSGVNEVEYVIR